LTVQEPAKCEYFLTMISPSVCTEPGARKVARDEL
jgi:hypothetical protein